MKDIIDKLKSMDKEQLDAAVKQAKEFAKTDAGQELVRKIKSGDGMQDFGIDKEKQNNIKKELEKNPHIAKTIFDILNGKG